MPRCSALDCRNMGSHTFPKDPDLRRLWEKATNKENFKASKHSRLCSGHFRPSDYIDMCISTGMTPFHRYLKKTAVPSIFPCNDQHSRASDASVTKAKTASHRHLKKGVVPTIFPWTKKALDTQPDKASRDSPIKDKMNSTVVSTQNVPQEQENNSTEENKPFRDRSVRLRNRKAYLAKLRCSVPQCNTRPSNDISLYPCPNNAAVRNEWAEALRVSYHYVKNMVACSLHFMKIDFIQSKNAERVLKHNAVPSRNLPHRKKLVVPVKHKTLKKEITSKAFERQKTMSDTVDESKDAIQVIRECRACLRKLDDKKSCCNVFQAWAPPWDGMEATIAEDLAKLASVEISITDRHSKVLCAPCYQKLLDAATFASCVRNCDLILRLRFASEIENEEKVWPKPIQIDKNINGSVYNNGLDIEIKQEVVSDEEYPATGTDNAYVDTELSNLDIKIEPEEFVEPPPMNITINGTISLDPLNSENKGLTNGTELHQELELPQETQFTEMEIKQEPSSEGEQETEQAPDLSLECLLCTKSFNSVTGLKAHVIAQHSYKTVKRKSDGSVSPEKKRCDKYKCAICRRSFLTSTDLMVHETCHNKHACYGCTEKFDSFDLLTRHRKRCKASLANSVQKLKTLEDVKRPLPEEKVEHLELGNEKIESKTINKSEDFEMKDLNNGQMEESEVNQAERVNDEENSDIKIESINEEVESNKKAESGNEEGESNKKAETGNEEGESNKKAETGNEEGESNKKAETGNEEGESNKKTKSENEEVESYKKAESGNEEVIKDEIKEESESLEITEDSDSNMKLHLEIHSTKSETESTLSDADMSVETLRNDDCT